MKRTTLALLGLSCAWMSCSKKEIVPVTATESAATQKTALKVNAVGSWTPANAVTAYNAFNTACYNPTAKLYYATTLKTSLAAIWTQAIFWDLAMDVYYRNPTAAQMTRITDMYTGGFNQYDGYNWNNTTVWFIYDDMMWWVMALARAHKLTGNATYLAKAQSGLTGCGTDLMTLPMAVCFGILTIAAKTPASISLR